VTDFLGELGKKIAERWLTLLVLPGLLWTATAVLATQLRWRHALSPKTAANRITAFARVDNLGDTVLIVVATLLASAAAGLTATMLGAVVRRLWTVRGQWHPGRWLVSLRQHRWDTAHATVAALVAAAVRASTASRAADPLATDSTAPPVIRAGPDIAEALAARDSISLEYPARPTWIGDRWRANSIRIHRAYGLDITVAWPRLWAILPEALRTDIATAQASYSAASILIGWSVLYGLVSILWWPAIFITIATLVTGTLHARTATTTLCVLIETAADLHTSTLAQQLHLPCSTTLTVDLGHKINGVLRKDATMQGPVRESSD